MNAVKSYITFLKEYKKLLERGIKDILASSNASNFIWLNDIEKLLDAGMCNSVLPKLFTPEFTKVEKIFTLDKPLLPEITISDIFSEDVFFDFAKNVFSSKNNDNESLRLYLSSEEGEISAEKIKTYKRGKEIYSKLFRAYNDIKNDSNLEIVLSIGLIQYAKKNSSNNFSKTNQHLFHFPLTLEISSKNSISLNFSESGTPYADFFFLNNAPIEKEVLLNIIEIFDAKIEELGFEYIYQQDFRKLISNSLQKMSDSSAFETSLNKPESDIYREDFFRISFSPAINIKYQKPRFFERLTDSIIAHNDLNPETGTLFNFLVRDPSTLYKNSHPKQNYFIDELYEENKESFSSLNAEEDFSVFFPLPYNTEQKSIYKNYLKNRLTVVTGPPGTGKSHTIVNILCTLLAQGKRVLVTAQTDKALESLLGKIPESFDDLIFTKIELENKKDRFSLSNSIERISDLLTKSYIVNIDNKLLDLDKLKAAYVKSKGEIINSLESEYSTVSLNESFSNLRPYQIVEKFLKKDPKEFNWIKDNLVEFNVVDFQKLKISLIKYQKLSDYEISTSDSLDIDLESIYNKLKDFDFRQLFQLKEKNQTKSITLGLNIQNRDKLLSIDLDRIIEQIKDFTNSDLVMKSAQEIDRLSASLHSNFESCDLTTNKAYSEIIENQTRYLLDIETYQSHLTDQTVSFFKRYTASFKKVAYLEDFTIDGKKCNTRDEIVKLKSLIEKISVLGRKFKLLKDTGFIFVLDERANVNEKFSQFEDILAQIERNKQLLNKTRLDPGLVNFSRFIDLPIEDIDGIRERAIMYREDLKDLVQLDSKIQGLIEILKGVNIVIERSKLKHLFMEFLPIYDIEDEDKYQGLLDKIRSFNERLLKENEFRRIVSYLTEYLPNTFPDLKNINPEYFTIENIDYAVTNQYLEYKLSINLQASTEKISRLNNEISKKKCEILFDLGKSNFKKKFDDDEIDEFINVLKEYKYNLSQSNRKIRDQVRYQILCRKNSIAISKKLSCWVMKFNDVLNSVGHEPEIFDCIIVDEASQLDFNSLILGYYGKTIIIVGDDKQTSPSSLTAADGNDFDSIKNKYLEFLGPNVIHIKSDNSLFNLSEMIAGTSNLTLKEHFRCVPELIEFSKNYFYNNSLRPLKQLNSNRLPPKKTVFVDNAISEDNIVHQEILQIKECLKLMLTDPNYKTKSIGVVSLGYTKHTEKLKDVKEDLVAEFGSELIDSFKIIIEDSPKFQGDERDVMLVSLGVALDYEASINNKNAKPTAIINDDDKKRKINVALSRAKEQMILFHSVKNDNLAPQDFRREIINFFYSDVKPLQPLILDNFNIQRDRLNVPTPFDSWFEADIAKSLIEHGYNYIQPQYKVKEDEQYFNQKLNKNVYVNFKIDLVVFNNGKTIAIECDGDPFHSLPEDVAYDIERQEFLERIGWRVYRILYSAFRRNPSYEIERLVSFIEANTKIDTYLIPPLTKLGENINGNLLKKHQF